jgi:hypothetical protein
MRLSGLATHTSTGGCGLGFDAELSAGLAFSKFKIWVRYSPPDLLYRVTPLSP